MGYDARACVIITRHVGHCHWFHYPFTLASRHESVGFMPNVTPNPGWRPGIELKGLLLRLASIGFLVNPGVANCRIGACRGISPADPGSSALFRKADLRSNSLIMSGTSEGIRTPGLLIRGMS
jgi:hypothetical protein